MLILCVFLPVCKKNVINEKPLCFVPFLVNSWQKYSNYDIFWQTGRQNYHFIKHVITYTYMLTFL